MGAITCNYLYLGIAPVAPYNWPLNPVKDLRVLILPTTLGVYAAEEHFTSKCSDLRGTKCLSHERYTLGDWLFERGYTTSLNE
jgi:hypothetical protein